MLSSRFAVAAPHLVRRLLPLAPCWAFVLFVAATGWAKSPQVPAFERLFSEHVDEEEQQPTGPPEIGGRLLLTELNCVACHAGGEFVAARAKQAPILTDVGARIRPNHLASYLLDPQAVHPGTTMPQVLDRFPEPQRREAARAIAHYLTALAGRTPPQLLPRFGDGEMGDRLFHQVGCIACHDSPREGWDALPTSKPFGDLAAKYTLPSLTAFLLDPHAVRPAGRMPSLQLSSLEARRIAAYLLQLPEVASVKVSYYEGSWQKLPDFDKLKPVSIDGVDEITIKHAKRKDDFALRFEGRLSIDRDGEYTFHLKSDDGSRLTIDGQVVVDHDGIHGETSKSGKATLKAGSHDVIVDVFERAGGELIQAEFEGPGVKRQPLHAAMAAGDDDPMITPIQFTANDALIDQGRVWWSKAGCASCHELRENDKLVGQRFTAPPLSEVRVDRGCLSDDAGETRGFDYRLRPTQLAALRAALQQPPVENELPIGHTLAAFNCYACHSRNGFGGVQLERSEHFQGTIPEMGDEGRIPPHLDGVGAKLTDKWLAKLLTQSSKDRPYMLTRMPRFGGKNVGHLQNQLAKVDRAELKPPPEVMFEAPLSEIKAAGRKLVGDKGLSCIKCHTFGRFRATGIQSIDMKMMSERLREDWFRRYLRNPQLFRPRTRMPTAWPAEGPSLIEDVLDADSERQIAAVWTYLSDGVRARIPSGVEIKTLELIPIDEAIIYRNFIQGAGSRAIAVGYPEGIHQAWDANELRLAMLWQGRFIDASRHWSGRGQGFQPPAGEKILQFPSGPTFARLDDDQATWPAAATSASGAVNSSVRSQRFRGYTLTADQRPTFQYQVHDAQVTEFLDTEVDDPETLAVRRFEVDSTNADTTLWVRLAIGDEIREAEDGWFVVDGQWRTRLHGAAPRLRDSNGKVELLAPLPTGKKHRLRQDLVW